MPSRKYDTWTVIAIAWAIAILLLVFMWSAFALDSPKWGHDAETSQWFKSLKNSSGTLCCDYVDGTRIEDPEDYTRNDDGSYDVKIEGKMLHVTPDRVLKGSNRVGYAIIWIQKGQGNVWCFLPGAEL